MKINLHLSASALLCAVILLSTRIPCLAQPLALHPQNPHYFLFKGTPTVLITSGEHYGAVLNLDFDYLTYLDTLASDRLNLTRTFSGAYVEQDGAFKITRNTLAPGPGRFICPWPRSSEPGYALGGNKFDLTKWDDAYFKRLTDFVAQADQRGVVVEMNLFCPFYDEAQWKLSPQNSANNINNIGAVPRTDVYTLDKHGGLLAVHEALTRKIVAELNRFDNVYYEICNEPYVGTVTMDWQHRIADVIIAAERPLGRRHLISQNVANGSKKIDSPHPGVSIFNFHYASPPAAVAENYSLNAVIGDNETGFKGNGDAHYRMEAWEFILAGGALYNNLDYSFAAGHERGDFAYLKTQPGGGNPAFRKQMKILGDFIRGFEFVKMRPAAAAVKSGLPEKARARVLAEPGRQYALYLFGGTQATLVLDIPPGKYRAAWVNVLTGATDRNETVDHAGGDLTLASPAYENEIALRVMRE
ncbi:MAG: cellulase family glycosylhydrolase [bacterium]